MRSFFQRGDAALFCLSGVGLVFSFIFLISPLPPSPKSLLDLPIFGPETAKLSLGPGLNSLAAPDAYLVQKNSLAGRATPQTIKPQILADLSDAAFSGSGRQEIIEYYVVEGDTLSSLAESFGISLETILWANNLKANSSLSVGQKLVILPVSGILHIVKAGQTLAEIAQTYKGNLQEIVDFNNLTDANEVFPGDIVIVPHGVLPVLPKPTSPVLAPLAAGYFICPIIAPCRVTQGPHWYNAIDFSHGLCGEPVLAAAGGQVQKVKLTSSASRWAFGGAGNHLTILHPNGVVTFYGHLQTSLVSPGQTIAQGQTIGLVGGAWGMPGSGKSTGCHLHFSVFGAKNPFAR
jgi:murein DD-endopeptidase MepM/ murein hydrolase activator NlpD